MTLCVRTCGTSVPEIMISYIGIYSCCCGQKVSRLGSRTPQNRADTKYKYVSYARGIRWTHQKYEYTKYLPIQLLLQKYCYARLHCYCCAAGAVCMHALVQVV